MTANDYVRAIHVFNEKNPQSNVVSVRLGPPAGQAKLSTRVRLADSQNIIAIAEMSDGTCWSDDVDVVVTERGLADLRGLSRPQRRQALADLWRRR